MGSKGNVQQPTSDCALCLCPLSKEVDSCQVLSCGHVYHRACVAQMFASNVSACPLCRTRIDQGRTMNASAYQPCVAGGFGSQQQYHTYPPRSDGPAYEPLGVFNHQSSNPTGAGEDLPQLWNGQPGAPGAVFGLAGLAGIPPTQRRARRNPHEQTVAPPRHPLQTLPNMAHALPTQYGSLHLNRPQYFPPGTGPAPGSLSGIDLLRSLQVAAAAAAPRPSPPQAPVTDPRSSLVASVKSMMPSSLRPAGHPPDDYMFLVDVSGSMGGTSMAEWSHTRCSRLTLALTYLACYIEKTVSEGDSVSVMAFDNAVATIKPVFVKGSDFNVYEFMDRCADAISSQFCRGKTRLYGATVDACTKLSEEVESKGHVDGAEHCLVVLTDGEATDPGRVDEAHRPMTDPQVPDGFKALLLKIDNHANAVSANHAVAAMQHSLVSNQGASSVPRFLKDLSRYTNGVSIPYVHYQEVNMPTQVSWLEPATASKRNSLPNSAPMARAHAAAHVFDNPFASSSGHMATLSVSNGFRTLGSMPSSLSLPVRMDGPF